MTGAINLSGLNGIDFNSIIDVIMKQESLPLTSMQSQQKAIQDKDSALTQLGSQVDDFKTIVNDLVSSTAFSKVAAASSDTTILTASAGSDAIAGHYEVVVDHLAKAQMTTSTMGFSEKTDVVANGGSISFTTGSETTAAITITGNTTLTELKDLVNAQESDVRASIVNTGTSYKMVLSSRSTGADAAFTINNSLTNSGGTAIAFSGTNTQDAIDSSFTVNGLTVQSASNTVSDAIPGISFTMVKGGSAAIDVTASYDELKSSVRTLVADYNKLRAFYTRQSTGALAHDSVMRQAIRDIRSAFQESNSNGGAFHYLSEVGIELTSAGDMKFVESSFNSAIADHPADLAKLFHGTNSDGVFNTMKTRLENLDSTAGLIKTTRDTIGQTLNRFRDRISGQQARLDQRRADLKKMYQAADQAMSQLSQTSASLTALSNRTI